MRSLELLYFLLPKKGERCAPIGGYDDIDVVRAVKLGGVVSGDRMELSVVIHVQGGRARKLLHLITPSQCMNWISDGTWEVVGGERWEGMGRIGGCGSPLQTTCSILVAF